MPDSPNAQEQAHERGKENEIKYEPPRILSFEPLADGSGTCSNGTSDATECSAGTNGQPPIKGCAGRSYPRRS